MKIINDRYDVIKLLHRESSFVEYLVSDKEKNKEIKRIRIFDTEMSNYDFIKQMEEQFVELKTVVHENILSVYEFQAIVTVNGNRVNRKQFFYTYEHFEEDQLVHYTELNKTEINSVIVQLCKAVRFLHFRGVIYKYLNFDQMLILRQNGQTILKLRDIASILINDYHFKMDHERFSQFIAPEIIWGEETDKHVDVYSLGMIVYYLYYRIDYKTKPLQNLLQVTHTNEIHKFISKSTSHIRDERPDSILKFIEQLSMLIWIEVDSDDLKYYDKIHDSTKIIGRDTLIKDVKRIIELKSKKAAPHHAILIQGENGSGKSRVLNEIYYIAKFGRYDYLHIRPTAFSEVFYTTKALIKHISKQDDVSPLLMQKYGQELCALVPELASTWNIKMIKDINVEVEYLRILNRVFNFFIEYISNKFFIILIDDIEGIHKYERAFFQLLLEYKGTSNYLLIGTGIEHETDMYVKKYPEITKVFKLSSLNLEETGLIVRTSLGLSEIPYKLTHRLMIENQGKASVTKRMIKKLWYDGTIFFDEKTMSWNLDEVDDSFNFDYVDQIGRAHV